LISNESQIIFDSEGEYNGGNLKNIDELEQNDNKAMLRHTDIAEYNLRVTLLIDNIESEKKLDNVRQAVFITLGIMIIMTLLVVFYISKKIYTPVGNLVEDLKMNETMKEKEAFMKEENELTYIRKTISKNEIRIKTIEEELQEKKRMLKKAQSVALQTQITPHFICNVLENMNKQIVRYIGKESDVVQMMKALSFLMKSVLEKSETFITLGEEIKYVKEYLCIQQKLLNDQFEVDIDVSEELKKCRFIKLLLQPVVENAIKHGIIPYGIRGSIVIEAKQVNEELWISVQDSGLGITQEEVDQINASIHEHVIKENEHIGLSNVNQRIMLAFGENYGVSVFSQIGGGTKVLLKIPFEL